MQTPSIGLALGAGAFRGLAHIGVLDVFEQEKINISAIAGCSMGSLIGAIYASGMPIQDLIQYGETFHERQVYDVVIPREGMLAGKKMQALVRELTNDKTFAETILPFAAIACDFETMETVVLNEGPLHEAVRASCSIPGIFVPFLKDNRMLVDGGLLERVPAALCRSLGVDIVIGIDVGYRGQQVKTGNIMQNVMHAIDIFEWRIAKQSTSEADLMIAPDVLDIDPLRIGGRVLECVERGRDAAYAALPKIRSLLVDCHPKEDVS